MIQQAGLQERIRHHAEQEATHADLFRRVSPQARQAQDDLFRALVKRQETRHKEWEENQAILSPFPEKLSENWLQSCARIKRRKEFHVESKAPVFNQYSRVAQELSLQPVRDMPAELIVIFSPDKRLDIIGAPYADHWTSSTGENHPALHSVSADPALGTMGFSQIANADHCESGAALWVQFLPLIAPGVAQIRAFTPFSYQWSSLSFKSREDNSAGFGVFVLSWDMYGKDMTTEQDYRYFAWNRSIAASYFANVDSPSWEEGPPAPGWDTDYAFIYGHDAPYFKVRPNRIYKAAIWCFGACSSAGERPGQAIGRVQAQLPWVVIGYQ